MASLNKVMLIGNLGKDPETRYTGDGTAVTSFSIATTEKWKDASGQPQERTEWHRITCWRRLAEIAGEYLRKGSPVYIEGKLTTRKWQDSEGKDRYTTEVVADTIQFLGSKQGGSERSDADDAPAPQRPAPRQRPAGGTSGGIGDMDDDIPF